MPSNNPGCHSARTNKDFTVEKGDGKTESSHSLGGWRCAITSHANVSSDPHCQTEQLIRQQCKLADVTTCHHLLAPSVVLNIRWLILLLDIPELISLVFTLMLTFIKLHVKNRFRWRRKLLRIKRHCIRSGLTDCSLACPVAYVVWLSKSSLKKFTLLVLFCGLYLSKHNFLHLWYCQNKKSMICRTRSELQPSTIIPEVSYFISSEYIIWSMAGGKFRLSVQKKRQLYCSF